MHLPDLRLDLASDLRVVEANGNHDYYDTAKGARTLDAAYARWR